MLRELKVVVTAEAQTEEGCWWGLGPHHTLCTMPKGSWRALMMWTRRGMVIFLFAKANSGARMRKDQMKQS